MKKILIPILILLAFLCGCGTAAPAGDYPEEDVIIAQLDTGVSTAAIKGENLLPGHNYVTGSADTEDRINHGTAVTSVILGCESAGVEPTAPDARIVPLVIADKVDGDLSSVGPDVLARAIRDSVDSYGADIINVSLGTKKDDPALREAIVYVQERGALVIAAAGNDGDSTELYYPAAYEGVLAVGSHDRNMMESSFSQKNGTADILAPGEDIWLASRNGKTYGAKGTSYATGYVSAAAALLWQQSPELTAGEVVQALLSSAKTVDGLLILDIKKETPSPELHPIC